MAFRRRANEIGTASNSAEKKGSPSEGVAEGGGWGEEFRHARAEVRQQADKLRRFRRLGIKTSKQNNFQILLRKIWRAGVKKLKENCFALLAEIRRAETRSGVNRAFLVQKRFELRSAIATKVFMDKLKQYKQQIDTFLASFLASKRKNLVKVNAWGQDAVEKIQDVVSEGKTIRGSLVLLLHDLLKGKQKQKALRVAAAFELIQTGLVIHDDIMDHDDMRRGKPAMHVQYKSEAMAMCVGDICFFLAQELLADTPIAKISARIFQEVGVAQMEDVAKTAQTKDDILSLYKYKTARYSFSLPMMAGAILASADKKTITLLEKLGEAMGTLFQIQNDTKNIAGDTREHKKTLARFCATQDIINKYKNNIDNILRVLPNNLMILKQLV